MRRTTFISALIACLAMLAAIAPAVSASGRDDGGGGGGSGTRTSIALTGGVSFPGATGKAVHKVKRGERELQIEVEHIRVLAGKHVNVFVNGKKLASPLVSSLGQIHVERNTGAGQTVPPINSGSTVRVRTLGGTMVAGGTF